MLQLIFHIIIITAFCFIWGVPALLVLNKIKTENNYWNRTSLSMLTFVFFSGIISLSIVTAWVFLWFPLNFTFLLLLTAALIAILLLFKKKEIKNAFKSFENSSSLSLLEISFIVVILLLFVLLGSIETVNRDTGIYHIQIILWTNEYAVVPGIANLFPRYGLGSNWFNLISSFRFPFLKNENFTYLNSTLAIWFFLWLFNNWRWHLNNFIHHLANKIFSLFYLLVILFCLLDWELFRDAANSTNYDFIATALTIIIIAWLIESILVKEINKSSSLFFIILCLSIIPFKLSGIFVLLLLLYFLIYNNQLNYWLQTVVVVFIILTPLLIKNYITTGYLLYPLTWSIFPPDWQVPAGMTDYLRNYIFTTNRFYNYYEIDYTRIPELLNKPWISSWFNGILIQHKIIFIASFSSLSLFFFKNMLPIDYKKLKLLFILLFLMAFGWFITAPSPRFGYGVLLFLAFFPFCYYAGFLFTPFIQRMIVIVIIAATSFYIYKKTLTFSENGNLLLYPVAPLNTNFKPISINGTNFYLPDKMNNMWMRKCNAIKLPCITQENNFLEPRGKNLKDGFRMKQQPDSTFIRNYNY